MTGRQAVEVGWLYMCMVPVFVDNEFRLLGCNWLIKAAYVNLAEHACINAPASSAAAAAAVAAPHMCTGTITTIYSHYACTLYQRSTTMHAQR